VAAFLVLAMLPAMLPAAEPPAAAPDNPDALLQELRERAAAVKTRLARLEAEQRELDREIAGLVALRARMPGAAPAPSAIPQTEPSNMPQAPAPTPLQQASRLREAPRPLSLRVGAFDVYPWGFVDFITVWRSRNVGSGIGTAFGSIPFETSVEGGLHETRLSAQNSRVSLRVESRRGALGLTGFLETDFLGAQPANAFVTSNSDSLRLRQYWANVSAGKWEVLAGQAWSLLTPNRTGIGSRPTEVFHTQVVDTNYQAGLTWTRAAQIRLVRHWSPQWTSALALENPHQFAGNGVVLPSSVYATQVDTGGNLATPNIHPDIIGKTAYDGKLGGRTVHAEAAGLLRTFRIRRNGNGETSTETGGGGTAAASIELTPFFRLLASSFYSLGGGRYVGGLVPDLVIRPDGTISTIRARSALAGFEAALRPNLLLYGYWGGIFVSRTYTGSVGFGVPGGPASASRSIQEPTIGLIRTLWRDPAWGAMQVMTQYSYVNRLPWSPPNGSGSASTHMVYLDLRYVLP
jgi:hypothetical protein